jgi:1,4-dihydroxy-6-naphthoate synthase
MHKNTNMTALILGFSPCPNDTFIFDALVHAKINTDHYSFDVHLADVEELNHMARRGILDVTKMSYRTFLEVQSTYQLLTSGGALGVGCGPLLISKVPYNLHDVPKLHIAIPGLGTTAHFLLDYVFPEVTQKTEMLFSDIEAAVLDGTVDAGVIIHENRFTYQQKGLLKIADLGAIWEKNTGAPIPLGCIAVHKRIPLPIQQEIQSLIRESLEYAFQNPESSQSYVQCHAQEMDKNVMQAHIDLYVNEFSLDIGDKGMSALKVMAEKLKTPIPTLI